MKNGMNETNVNECAIMSDSIQFEMKCTLRVISSSWDFQSASHISLNGLQTTEPAANFWALNSTLNP